MSVRRGFSPSRRSKTPTDAPRKLSSSRSPQQKQTQAEDRKKAAADSMVSDLTNEELLELFRVVDTDGGGTISRDELKAVMVF